MRYLRYCFRISKLFNNSKMALIGWRVAVRLRGGLGRVMGRVGNVLVLSRSWIEGYLALVLVVGGQLGWDVNLMAKTALVDLRVWGLILIGRNASECGLLKLVGVLHRQLTVSNEAQKGSGESWETLTVCNGEG